MLRGSRPGERRGGRMRGTPNKRTILRDRILSIGLDHPAASQRAFLRKLVKDRRLAADIRMAVVPKCFPPKRTRSFGKERREALTTEGSAVASKDSQSPAVVPAIRDWTPQAFDALIGIVQDAAADPKAQKRAALKIAEFLLPKVGKKAKVIPDEYGFSIRPNLASAYRDMQLELRALVNGPARKIPANAEKIKRLEARSDAIRRRLQVPCPTKYSDKEAANDSARLIEFILLRDNEIALTEAQKAEEAHVKARLDVFCFSPESIARRRRQALEDADHRFRMSRFMRESYAPPLSRKDRSDLKFLRRLYPKANRNQSRFDGDEELAWYRDHPFAEELIGPDGNFYAQDSKLRPAGALGDLLLEEPKARIYELEKRRGREYLAPTEEEELQDLRRRHPRIAEVVSQMNLEYDFWFEQELKIATKAGLAIGAAIQQAELICLRFEKSGCISKWDLKQLRDDGTWPWHPPASPADTATPSANEPEPTK
jgi:hypothetical protein